MVIDMNEAKLETIEQIREFLSGTAGVSFSISSNEVDLHAFIATVLTRFGYFKRRKSQRGVLFAYMRRLTGYSRQHLSRLLVQYRDTRSLKPQLRSSRTSFTRRYTPADVALLAETDALHDTLSGPATTVLLRRGLSPFGPRGLVRVAHPLGPHSFKL